MKKQYVVVGLGSFGQAVADELMRLGHEVLGIEHKEDRANRLADRLTQVVIGDASDERVLSELGLEKYDAALIAIGENIEASILCTMHLKTLGVAQIWVKAITTPHHRIVEKLGADRIIHPELEMGLRAAQSMNYPNMLDYISLGDNYFVIEVRPGEGLQETSIRELALERYDIRLLAIKHGNQVRFDHSREHRLKRNDHLVLLGSLEELRHFTEALAKSGEA